MIFKGLKFSKKKMSRKFAGTNGTNQIVYNEQGILVQTQNPPRKIAYDLVQFLIRYRQENLPR